MTSDIAERIDRIVSIFKAAREVAEEEGQSEALKHHLTASDSYYRSVAYEGAAMGLALRDISQWEAFLKNDAAAHAVQVHIGLGWALAEQALPCEEDARWQDADAVLDGYGYYHGLFRRRLSIRTQGIPDGINAAQLPGFDRGLGRSLWYISKGDMELLLRMIAAFTIDRQPHLWRGVGIAVAYVGGCNEALLRDVWDKAKNHRPYVEEGAIRAARSRIAAATPLDDVDHVLRIWTGKTAKEAVQGN